MRLQLENEIIVIISEFGMHILITVTTFVHYKPLSIKNTQYNKP